MTLVFFTDRDLGTLFPEILKDAGFAVERHRDHFPPDCPDEQWLPDLAASFVATREHIEAFLEGAAAPIIAKVYRATPSELAENPAAAGRIERRYPK